MLNENVSAPRPYISNLKASLKKKKKASPKSESTRHLKINKNGRHSWPQSPAPTREAPGSPRGGSPEYKPLTWCL